MEISQSEFESLRHCIHKICGIMVAENKQYLIKTRLEPVLRTYGYDSFAQLHGKLVFGENGRLVEEVIEAITTNETFFFRDDHPFTTFKKNVLPALSDLISHRKRRGSKVRIWCAASSTGQEPYTIAMLINEYVKNNSWKGIAREDFGILATDISSSVLSQAIQGEYSDMEVNRGLPVSYRDRYFRKERNRWFILDELKQMIDFKRLNLKDNFEFLGGFDMIFCRNVLIYFDDNKKRTILTQMHNMLNRDGFLLLGSTENLYCLSDQFVSRRLDQTTFYVKCSD